MNSIRLSIFGLISLSLISGCSSSSTSGGTNPPASSASRNAKSPDDEARELLAKAKSMSREELKANGEAMAKRVRELRSQVSQEMGKEIDIALNVVTWETTERGEVKTIVEDPEPVVIIKAPNSKPPVISKTEEVETVPPPREKK